MAPIIFLYIALDQAVRFGRKMTNPVQPVPQILFEGIILYLHLKTHFPGARMNEKSTLEIIQHLGQPRGDLGNLLRCIMVLQKHHVTRSDRNLALPQNYFLILAKQQQKTPPILAFQCSQFIVEIMPLPYFRGINEMIPVKCFELLRKFSIIVTGQILLQKIPLQKKKKGFEQKKISKFQPVVYLKAIFDTTFLYN